MMRKAILRAPRLQTRGFASATGTQITTLPNGLRVVTEPSLINTQSSTVGLYVDTGSRYESEKTNGVAHFLEHMSFKGTQRRTRAQLEREIEDMGAHLNAYTSRENTVFYAKVFDNNVDQALDVLSDITQNSKYDEQDVEAERGVILREAEEVAKQEEEMIFDHLHHTAFRGSSLARTILGPEENIKSIQQKDIKDFVATHYTAPRMVIAASGYNIDHGKIVNLASKYFGNVASAPPAGLEVNFEPAAFVGSDIMITDDDMPLAHVAFSFSTAGWNDYDSFPLMLIQTMIGNWDASQVSGKDSSSPLVARLAGDGLARSVSAFNTQYSDAGLFGVYYTAEQHHVRTTSLEICKTLTNLCYQVDDALVQEAKNRLKITFLTQNDGTTGICEEIGRQVLTLGRRMPLTEVFARIDAIDTAAVKACARRFFYDRDHALAAHGPLHELPDYNELRGKSYLYR